MVRFGGKKGSTGSRKHLAPGGGHELTLLRLRKARGRETWRRIQTAVRGHISKRFNVKDRICNLPCRAFRTVKV